jgi:hypothetical protein
MNKGTYICYTASETRPTKLLAFERYQNGYVGLGEDGEWTAIGVFLL